MLTVFLSNPLPSTFTRKQHLSASNTKLETPWLLRWWFTAQLGSGSGRRHRLLRPTWGRSSGWWQFTGSMGRGSCPAVRGSCGREMRWVTLSLYLSGPWSYYVRWFRNSKCRSWYIRRANVFFVRTRLKDLSLAKNAKERSSQWRVRKRVSWTDFVFIVNLGIFRIGLERNEKKINFIRPSIEHLLHADSMPALVLCNFRSVLLAVSTVNEH